MNSLPLHPALVHIPLGLAVVLPLLGAGVLLAWWRGWLSPRAWVLVIGLQAALLVSGIVTLQSGEREEDRVEQVVPEAAIHEHEEAAEIMVWGSGAVLGLALLPLLMRKRRESLQRWSALGAVAGSLVVAGLAVHTGEEGGKLVYQHGAASAYVAPQGDPGSPAAPARSEARADDDD